MFFFPLTKLELYLTLLTLQLKQSKAKQSKANFLDIFEKKGDWLESQKKKKKKRHNQATHNTLLRIAQFLFYIRKDKTLLLKIAQFFSI